MYSAENRLTLVYIYGIVNLRINNGLYEWVSIYKNTYNYYNYTGVGDGMSYSNSTVFVTGHAKPAKDDAINAVYQVFSLSLIIERETDTIVDVACTMVMGKSEEFIRSILCGKNIVADMEDLQQEIRARFLTLAQKPMVVALRDAQNRYLTAFPDRREK